jgi:hypothetical protein
MRTLEVLHLTEKRKDAKEPIFLVAAERGLFGSACVRRRHTQRQPYTDLVISVLLQKSEDSQQTFH